MRNHIFPFIFVSISLFVCIFVTDKTTLNTYDNENDRLFKCIRQLIPKERIYTDELRRLGWGTDASFYREIPQMVVRSDNEAEVARLVKLCRQHQVPFTFRAAGTSLSGQSLSNSVLIVAGKHWEQYEIGEQQETITLQPGLVGGRVN